MPINATGPKSSAQPAQQANEAPQQPSGRPGKARIAQLTQGKNLNEDLEVAKKQGAQGVGAIGGSLQAASTLCSALSAIPFVGPAFGVVGAACGIAGAGASIASQGMSGDYLGAATNLASTVGNGVQRFTGDEQKPEQKQEA